MTSLPRLGDVLGAAVRARDLRLGTVTGVVCDTHFERLLGLEATGRDGVRHFVPWVVVDEFHDEAVAVPSPFVLVDTGELDGYARLGAVLVRDPIQLAGLGVGPGGEITHGAGGRGVSSEVASGIESV